MKKKLILFDTETNGTNPKDSVLSISAMKVEYDTETDQMVKLGEFDRFYFRNEGEEPNEGALRVNGLYDDEIERRRNLSLEKYPRTFIEDVDNFYNFCDGAQHFIAHNIRFDRQFIPFILPYQFDTMLENIETVKIPSTNGYSKYNIKIEEDELHNSMYDVIIMGRVLFKMTKTKSGLEKVRKFVVDNISTSMR